MLIWFSWMTEEYRTRNLLGRPLIWMWGQTMSSMEQCVEWTSDLLQSSTLSGIIRWHYRQQLVVSFFSQTSSESPFLRKQGRSIQKNRKREAEDHPVKEQRECRIKRWPWSILVHLFFSDFLLFAEKRVIKTYWHSEASANFVSIAWQNCSMYAV